MRESALRGRAVWGAAESHAAVSHPVLGKALEQMSHLLGMFPLGPGKGSVKDAVSMAAGAQEGLLPVCLLQVTVSALLSTDSCHLGVFSGWIQDSF